MNLEKLNKQDQISAKSIVENNEKVAQANTINKTKEIFIGKYALGGYPSDSNDEDAKPLYRDSQEFQDLLLLERQGWLFNIVWKNYGSLNNDAGRLSFVFKPNLSKENNINYGLAVSNVLRDAPKEENVFDLNLAKKVFALDGNNDDSLAILEQQTKEKQKALRGISSFRLASLFPKIQLYGVYKVDGKKQLIPFKFSNYSYSANDQISRSEILFSQNDISGLGGITSLSIADTIQNSADVNISAEMSFYFRNLNAFLDDTHHPETSAEYTDILYTFIKKNRTGNKKEFLNEIIAEIGWSINPNDLHEVLEDEIALNALVQNSNKIYSLGILHHDLDLGENGEVNIKAYFVGRPLAALSDATMNLFSNDNNKNSDRLKQLQQEKDKNENELSKLDKEKDKFKYDKIKFQVDQTDKEIKDISSTTIDASRRKIINHLIDANALWKIKFLFPSPAVNFNESNATDDNGDLQNRFDLSLITRGEDSFIESSYKDEVDKKQNDDKNVATPPETGETFFFFTLIELLRASYKTFSDSIHDDDKVREMPNIILGKSSTPLLYGNSFDEEVKKDKNLRRCTSLAEMPIELSVFNQWLVNKFVRTGKINLTFSSFLQEIVSSLLPYAVYSGARADLQTSKPTVGVNSMDFTSTSEIVSNDGIILVKDIAEMINNGNSRVPTKDEQLFNYHIISGLLPGTSLSQVSLNPTEQEDNKNGILKIYYGTKNGIVKSLKFSKTEIQGQAELLLQQSSKNNLTNSPAFVPVTFNVNLVMVGNCFFRPSKYFRLDPVLFNISPEKDPGLFGLYFVTKVEHSFEDGVYETKIQAIKESAFAQ